MLFQSIDWNGRAAKSETDPMRTSKIDSIACHEGSVLVATVLTVFLVALMVAAGLKLVGNQNYSVMRTHSWNKAIPVAEAGIEEAFTHLKDDADLTANSWATKEYNGETVYRKDRAFSDGSSYSVMISKADTLAPVVYSQASVAAPFGRGNLVRTVRVTSTPRGVFAPGGITVKKSINLGSDFLIDSYDSTNPFKSTGGKYDPAKAQANGNLASVSANAGQLMLADSKIFGHLYSTPTGGYTPLGSDGMVGDQVFQSNPANVSKIQPGYYSNDLNITIPDVDPPTGYASFPTPTASQMNQTVAGVLYAYVLGTGNYQLPAGTTLKGNVLIQGDAVLYIPSTGRIQFGSGDVINIDASNASLKMYNASTKDAVMKDVSNSSAIPSKFTYYGLPTTAGSKLTMTGSGAYAFAGLINAPNQDVVLKGSNGGNQDFVGAIIANNFTMSGHTYMHIDESLLQGGDNDAIPVINSYAEISPINFPTLP